MGAIHSAAECDLIQQSRRDALPNVLRGHAGPRLRTPHGPGHARVAGTRLEVDA